MFHCLILIFLVKKKGLILILELISLFHFKNRKYNERQDLLLLDNFLSFETMDNI